MWNLYIWQIYSQFSSSPLSSGCSKQYSNQETWSFSNKSADQCFEYQEFRWWMFSFFPTEYTVWCACLWPHCSPTAVRPPSNWATSWHHMAQFSACTLWTLWILPAPEEFCASVLVQLWGVPTFEDDWGWVLSLLANSTKFHYSGQPHISEIFIRDLTKRWKINESLFSWSSRFSKIVSWNLHEKFISCVHNL